jgi:TonB-linked SusC/RagA family outer membrane protein
MLSQVVITGYYSLSRERSAGSFSRVNADEIKYKTGQSLVERLNGLTPGLVVNPSGQDKYLLRGLTSINSTRAPLFIVDGMPMELNELESTVNPEDVVSVNVLKDATATSIWGARAANGVIVFTTKRGGFKEKIAVSYTGSFQTQGLPDFDYLDYMNAKEYVDFAAKIYDSSYDYAGLLNQYGLITPVERILYNRQTGMYSAEQANRELDILRNSDNLQQIKDHFYQWKAVQQHNLNIKGGSENAAYFVSFNYRNIQPQQKRANEDRILLDTKNDFKITPWMKFSLGANISYLRKTAQYTPDLIGMIPYESLIDNSGKNKSQMHAFYSDERMQFLNDRLDERGMMRSDFILLDEINKQSNRNEVFNSRIQAGLRINPIKSLTFESDFQYQNGTGKTEQLDKANAFEVWNVRAEQTPLTAGSKSRIPNGAILNKTVINTYEWIVRNQFNYEQTLNHVHAINALAGTEVRKNKSARDNRIVYGYNETSKRFVSLDEQSMLAGIPGGTITNPNSAANSVYFLKGFGSGFLETDNRFFSLYANAAYNYDGRYGVNASIRIDQANLFGTDIRYKPIWSTGVLWNIHREGFFQKNFFDRLSLRTSYGIAGNVPNANIGGPYDIISANSSANFMYGQAGSSLSIVTPALRNLRWEKTKIVNFGIDFSILHNRLSGSVDFYHKNTNDLIGNQVVDPTNGFSQIFTNIGKMKNTGIEIALNSTNISTKNFTWTTSLNLAYNKNTITDIYVDPVIADYVQHPAFIQGYAAYGLFSYQWAGLSETGEPMVYNEKGEATMENITDVDALVYSGTAQPPFTGSLINSFTYKNVTLSAQIIYNLGHKIRNDVPSYSDNEGRLGYSQVLNSLPFINPVHRDMQYAWSRPGDQTNVPRWVPQGYTRKNRDYYPSADINIIDGSYIYINDITLSYAIPQTYTKQMGIGGCSVGAQVANPYCWTANKDGVDPRYITSMAGYGRSLRYGAEYMLKLAVNF